ncbi:MAG: hypothetical protein SGILL_002033 [Bacillariaceae sp.]
MSSRDLRRSGLLAVLCASILVINVDSFNMSPLPIGNHHGLRHQTLKPPHHPTSNSVFPSKSNRAARTPPGFPLISTPQPLEENDDKPTGNVFQKAKQKFQARPGTYLLIPVIAAFVGWFTNYLAVQMIFYPIQFRGIPLYRRPEVPLGLLGWQGIVPCKTKTMSEALVTMVTSELLTVQDAFAKLNPWRLAMLLSPEVPELGSKVITNVLAEKGALKTISSFPFNLWTGATHHLKALFHIVDVPVLTVIMRDLIRNCQNIFSLENCVVNQMLMDRAKLGELFRKVGQKELDFLTNSGLWFGFLLGLIQMAVALVWENPWALSIGGMIVGLATNWLALKWIFEPIHPTKIGPFTLQGMFLKRQPEVAAEFSKFFASKVVNSKQIWNSILTDPTTTPVLAGVLHLSSGLHQYVDKALGLEEILRVRMMAMSPEKFERVLHPIFEQDELTLIIAGGVLGFAAGLIQQGIETGAIKLSNPLPRIKRISKNVWTFVSTRTGTND